MKTFNEQTDLRIASLMRQRDAIQRQIDALLIYRAATKPSARPSAPKKTKPTKPAKPTTSKKRAPDS